LLSGDGDFFVGAEDGAEGIADFAEGGVGFYGVVDEGHQVGAALGGFAEGVEPAIDFGGGAIGAELGEAGGLAVGYGFVDLQDFEGLFFGYVVVHAYDDFFFFIHGHLIAVAGFGDFALGVALFDGGDHATHGIDAADVVPGALLDFVGEGFEEIGAAKGIDGVGDAGFVGDDLLGAQGEGGGEFGGEGPGFVEGIGVQGLRAAKNSSKGLNGGADDVVHRLLRGEGAAGGLRVETQGETARVGGFVPLGHRFVPDPASGAVLGDFLEEIVVGVEEEGELRDELVHGEAAADAPFDVFHAVAEGEGEFLDGGGTSFADVIAADGDNIEFGGVLHAELEGVYDQAHGGF